MWRNRKLLYVGLRPSWACELKYTGVKNNKRKIAAKQSSNERKEKNAYSCNITRRHCI